MNKILSLDCQLSSDLMTTVRLTTGGICSHMGLDIDATEDCKVCVTESLLLLIHGGYSQASVSFFEDEGIYVEIEAKGNKQEIIKVPDDGISSALLFALASDVNMEKEKDCLKAIEFRFVKNGR